MEDFAEAAAGRHYRGVALAPWFRMKAVALVLSLIACPLVACTTGPNDNLSFVVDQDLTYDEAMNRFNAYIQNTILPAVDPNAIDPKYTSRMTWGLQMNKSTLPKDVTTLENGAFEMVDAVQRILTQNRQGVFPAGARPQRVQLDTRSDDQGYSVVSVKWNLNGLPGQQLGSSVQAYINPGWGIGVASYVGNVDSCTPFDRCDLAVKSEASWRESF